MKPTLTILFKFGIGEPVPVKSFQKEFDGSLAFIWVDNTDGTSFPSPTNVMARITSSFTPGQLAAVEKIGDASDIPSRCPQNFNLFSQCWAAVIFSDIPGNSTTHKPVNYTIRADAGLAFIDSIKHTSDFEVRILPIQWALDQVSPQIL